MTLNSLQSFFDELTKISALGDQGSSSARSRLTAPPSTLAQRISVSAPQSKPKLPRMATPGQAMNSMTRMGVVKSPQTSASHLADSMARKGMLQRAARVVVK